MDLRELGEFGFIDRLRQRFTSIGDDAAVIGNGTLVAATDSLVEDVHFRLEWSDPTDVGWKVVAVNVSDVAAMGAEPRWLLVSLGAPATTDADVLDGLYAGMAEAAEAYGAEIVGGDTVLTPSLWVSVAVIGALGGDPMLRSGAEVGDALAVTGPLGRAAAGVNLLSSGKTEGVSPEDAIACMDAHKRPVARAIEGVALARAGAHAAIDLSDGLASDVRHIAQASGVGVELDRIPIAPQAARIAEARGWDAVQMALAGGEDYELLVALPEGVEAPVELIEIGRVIAEDGVFITEDGERRALGVRGWDHFTR